MEKKEEKKKPSGSFSEVWDKRGQETDAANDFRKKIEMEITEARPGYAVGEIVLKPWHMNILGIVHGGVLYSLADTVGGTAAMTGRDYAVPTVDGTIHYLKAGKNTSKIIARAQEIQGRLKVVAEFEGPACVVISAWRDQKGSKRAARERRQRLRRIRLAFKEGRVITC